MTVEFAARLPLSRNELDRDAEFRTTDDVERVLREDDRTRYLPVRGAEMLRNADGTLRFVTAAEIPVDTVTLYLGRAVSDAADAAGQAGIPLEICGEAASDPLTCRISASDTFLDLNLT